VQRVSAQEKQMSRGSPSLVAFLGLLAVAGYQNRDKIAEMLGKLKQGPTRSGLPDATHADDDLLGRLGGLLGGSSLGNVLSGGLGELVDRFKQSGHGQAAESWVGPGTNQSVEPTHLEQAIGLEVLETLSQRTGLSRDELLARLTQELPTAVDRLTPDGRLPTEAEAARLL
jgi:uncharacterized protein YidB (DUF937 family)